MNDSTATPSPLLANLAVGDMVTHRWRYHLTPYSDGVYGSDLCGIVTDIRSQRRWANLDTMHTVVDVAWISGPWAKDGKPPTTYEVEDMRLIGGEHVLTVEDAAAEPERKAARTAFFGYDPHDPNATPPTSRPRRRVAKPVATAPVRASSTPAPATTAAPAARKRWSKVQIVAMIKEKEGAVDRGVLCLNKHAALLPEKTRSFVAFWAGWVGSGKTLSGKHLANARRTCLFNAKVLVDAANGDI